MDKKKYNAIQIRKLLRLQKRMLKLNSRSAAWKKLRKQVDRIQVKL